MLLRRRRPRGVGHDLRPVIFGHALVLNGALLLGGMTTTIGTSTNLSVVAMAWRVGGHGAPVRAGSIQGLAGGGLAIATASARGRCCGEVSPIET